MNADGSMGTMSTMSAPAPVNAPIPQQTKDPKSFDGYIDIYAVNKYQFLDEAYRGDGGFLNNGYLVPYPVEVYYNYRRRFSHYVNFFQSVLDAMVRPCFMLEPKRTITGSKIAEAFIDNVDGMGTTLTEFTKKAVTQLRRHSVVYIGVDNIAAKDMPSTEAESIKLRKFPYVYLKSHAEVDSLKIDVFGALSEIVFVDGEHEVSDSESKKAYRRINKDFQQRFYKGENGTEIQISSAPSPGVFPVVALRDGDPINKADYAPFPKMFTLARICHAIYNKDSEMREIERKQEFAVFYMAGDPPSGSMSAGAGSAIFCPIDSPFPPGYAAPPPETLAGLLSARKELREDLYRVAEQNGVQSVTQAKSGLALDIEFRALAFVLNESSNFAETIERGIMRVVFAYDNKPSAKFETAYHRAFSASDDANQNALDEILLTMDIPKKFKDDIIVDLYRKRFPEATKEDENAIETELEKTAIDATHSGSIPPIPHDTNNDGAGT